MKKSILLLASMLMGTSAFAQWVNPTLKEYGITAPKAMAEVPTGDIDEGDANSYGYLFNEESGGFFLGANDWGTRASVCDTLGHKVFLQDMDGGSGAVWAIVNYVLQGPNDVPNTWRGLYAPNPSALWVDNFGGENAQTWSITKLADGKFTIANIAENAEGVKPFENMTLGAYPGKCPVGDTRLYMANKDTEKGFGDTWYFVAEEDYEAYIESVKAIAEDYYTKANKYDRALALNKAIEDAKAQYEGINVKSAEDIYNNGNSTLDELNNAINKIIPTAIKEYVKAQTTVENPKDYTENVPNNDFENATAGWTTTTGASNVGLATNRCDNSQYPGTTMTGKFWENWKNANFKGQMYTELTNMPGGVYMLEMDAFSASGSDAYVFMNNYKTNQNGKTSDGRFVPLACGNDIPARFQLFGEINDGDSIRIGLDQTEATAGWIGIDNVKLTYYGDAIEAYQYWFTAVGNRFLEKMEVVMPEGTKYDINQKALFDDILAKGKTAQTKEEIFAKIKELEAVADSTLASAESYTALVNLINDYKSDQTEYDEDGPYGSFIDLLSDSESDAASALEDIKDNEKLPAGKLIEVTPIKILTECTYSSEYVKNYVAALRELHDECTAQSMLPGTDITGQLVDADFTDKNGKGWTHAFQPGNFTWSAGLSKFPVAESYHSKFDFYQDVTVADGIYSLSLNGFCRLDGSNDVAAEVYMNDFSSPFQNLALDPIEEDSINDGFNAYKTTDSWKNNPDLEGSVPSGAAGVDRKVDGGYIPDGMIGASVAFYGGRYEAKVYGLVEGGKIRLGARCSATDQWVLWGNFKLTYEGETDAAIKGLSTAFLETANNFLEDNESAMSTPAVTALQDAINAVVAAEEKEAKFAAIKALNAELKNAKANIAAVEAFEENKAAMDAAGEEYAETASTEAMNTYYVLADVQYGPLTTEQLGDYTAKFRECVCAMAISSTEQATDENPIDITPIIINPDFEVGNNDGWTHVKREGANGNFMIQNGFNGGKSMEFWSDNSATNKFDFYQDITNLPAGTYELSADASNSLNGVAAASTDGCAVIYAAKGDGETFTYLSTPIEVQTEGCADLYANYSVIIKLEEGQTLRIGAMNAGVLKARWVMIDNFTLTSYGKESAEEESEGKEAEIEVDIDEAPAAAVAPVAIYSAAGAKINALQKGINIVVMSDGTVAKILVK